MKKRTIREFTYKSDLWSVVDSWAAGAEFTLEQQEDSFRSYKKGRWLLMAPTIVEIRQDGDRVTLQTWLKADLYLTMNLMTGKPPEGGLESGGLNAWIQRKRAREAVNRLLKNLGQKPIT